MRNRFERSLMNEFEVGNVYIERSCGCDDYAQKTYERLINSDEHQQWLELYPDPGDEPTVKTVGLSYFKKSP
jgi:hypothetical protein